MKAKFLIIDGSGYLWKYHSVKDSIVNSDGYPIHGRLRFAQNVLLRCVHLGWATHIAVVFDHSGTNFRHEIYPAYKGNREGMPESLRYELDHVSPLCDAFGLKSLCEPDVEADDVIASLVEQYASDKVDIMIATRDKDLMQLVRPGVSLYRDRPVSYGTYGRHVVVKTREDVFNSLGVYPEQVVDYLALAGDSADGFPGVVGAGPKSVQAWLAQSGSLEALIENPGIIPQTRQRNAFLKALKAPEGENIATYKALASLKTDLSSFGSFDSFRPVKNDKASLIFAAMGMDWSLIEQEAL